MCNQYGRKPTKLPAHPQVQLDFYGKESFNDVHARMFDYVFPVVKYAPAHFQPGPVYYDPIAWRVGHQSWNFSQVWTAYSTPKQMDYHFVPSYKGSQSAASFAVAQNAMSQLLAMRSINSGG